MKNIVLSVAIMLIASVSVFGQKDMVEAKIHGMGCPFCAYGVEKKFKDLDGVKKLKIDLENATMTFTIPTMDRVQIKDIRSRIEAAGYTAVFVHISRANGKKEKWVNKEPIEEEKDGK